MLCTAVHWLELQMFNASWELYCLEHGIQPDGQLLSSLRPLDFFASWPLATGVWPDYTIFSYDHFYIEQVRHSTEEPGYALYIAPAACDGGGVGGGEGPDPRHGAL
jgi:hypothetical protein